MRKRMKKEMRVLDSETHHWGITHWKYLVVQDIRLWLVSRNEVTSRVCVCVCVCVSVLILSRVWSFAMCALRNFLLLIILNPGKSGVY